MTVTPRPLGESGVMIAGGTSGVGLASAKAFADAGVRRIALLARDVDRGALAVAAVRAVSAACDVQFFAADAFDPAQLSKAAEAAKSMLGTVDVLVNSTTSTHLPALFHTIPPETIVSMLTQQALPPIILSRIVLPWMREQGGGSIINIASDAAKAPTPGETVLGGAMAAIVMFTRTLAMEAKRNGVRVNAVTPSLVVGTPTGDRVLESGFSKKLFEKAATLAHLGMTEPEDLAALIVFLGSPASAKLTGQAISVNGGISA